VVDLNISAKLHFPVQLRVELSRNGLSFSSFKTRSRYLCVNSIKRLKQH